MADFSDRPNDDGQRKAQAISESVENRSPQPHRERVGEKKGAPNRAVLGICQPKVVAYDRPQYGNRLAVDHVDERAKENEANDDPAPRVFAWGMGLGGRVTHLNLSRMAWIP